jgi:hypothetical protein
VHAKLNKHSRHGSANLAGIAGVSLGSADVLDGSLVVNDGDLSDFTVHLEKDLTLAGILTKRTDGEKLQDKDLALLEFDIELFTNLGLAEEVSGWEDRQIAVLLLELLEVLKNLGVHDVGSNVALGHRCAVLLGQILLDLGEVDRLEEQARTLVKLATATQSIRAKRLGESSVWLAHHTLKELQNRAREVKFRGASLDILSGELVRDHELGKVTNHLGGWGDLDNVAKQVVGMLIGFLGLEPLGAKAKLGSLEHHVGKLATGNFVLVDLGVGTRKVSLEGRVEKTKL